MDPRPNVIIRCHECGQDAMGSLDWDDEQEAFGLAGVVLPITPELQVELSRRKAPVLCMNCWEGKPIQKKSSVILP